MKSREIKQRLEEGQKLIKVVNSNSVDSYFIDDEHLSCRLSKGQFDKFRIGCNHSEVVNGSDRNRLYFWL